MNTTKLAAYKAIVFSTLVILLLITLHLISPEFDPSWKMVSEYANGDYSWVLSLMFLCWAFSSWTLAFAIFPLLKTRAGKIGLLLLIISGVGELMAAAFDINHSLHSLAAFIGIGSFPFASMLISRNLSRLSEWSTAKKSLLNIAHLTWISVVLMIISFALLMITYSQAGGDMSANAQPVSQLPEGVIGIVGWTNRFLIITYCVWIINTAWNFIRIQK